MTERQLNPTGIVGACLTNDSDSNVGVSSGNPWSYSRWRNGYIVQLSSQWSIILFYFNWEISQIWNYLFNIFVKVLNKWDSLRAPCMKLVPKFAYQFWNGRWDLGQGGITFIFRKVGLGRDVIRLGLEDVSKFYLHKYESLS